MRGATSSGLGLAVLLLCGSGCATLRTAPSQAAIAEQSLLAADRAFARAMEEHGAEGWASFFADNGEMLVNGGGVVRGPAAVRERMARLFATPGFHLRFTPQRAEVSASGELGYTFGLYEARVEGPPESAPARSRGKYVSVWRKNSAGQWRILVEVGSEGQQMPASP